MLVEGAGGAARAAGIQSGDVLLTINATPMAIVAQAASAMSGSGRTLALSVLRDSVNVFGAIQGG